MGDNEIAEKAGQQDRPIKKRKGRRCPDCGFTQRDRRRKWCPRCNALLYDIVEG